MPILSKLVPLVIFFIVLAFVAFVGYAIYTIAMDVVDKSSKKMEEKNVSFGKEGMKIGVKEVKTENYVDQTQRYGHLFERGRFFKVTPLMKGILKPTSCSCLRLVGYS